MTYTLAGLLMLAAAFVGLLDTIGPLRYARTSKGKTADQRGRRFINPEAVDERKTTR